MIKKLICDHIFLAGKSEVATKEKSEKFSYEFRI